MLLLPLENVQGSPVYHPEGDVLYHSLQVFEQARDRRPYDEEFLLAALLHDVGKGLDRRDHVEAALAGAGRSHHGADAVPDRPPHARPRLPRGQAGRQAAPRAGGVAGLRGFDAVLASATTPAGCAGAVVGTVDEALNYLRELECENNG